MKKYIGFLIVLSVFVLGARGVKAEVSQNTACASTATPSITVLSPNGGETYTVGQQIEVKWKSCNIPSTATIVPVFVYQDINDVGESVHNSGGQSLDHVLNTGNTIITPPSSFLNILGKHFKIGLVNNSALYATDASNIQTRDYSDDTFTINIPGLIYHDGCSNGEKYSSTTGQICTEYGCKHGEKYSSTTGQVCPVIPEVVDNGCNGTVYSTTTGKLCGTCSASGAGCYKPNYIDTKPILIYPSGCSSFEGYSSVTGVACAGACSSSATGCPNPNTTNLIPIQRILKIGAKGEDVKTVQTILGIKADGSYGPITKAKVIEWQTSNGLKADGVFGPASSTKAGLMQ